jgi:hypothetical protein
MNHDARKSPTGLMTWLPFASLALTAAAFSMGASGRIARDAHLLPSIPARLSVEDESIPRGEPTAAVRRAVRAWNRRRAGT